MAADRTLRFFGSGETTPTPVRGDASEFFAAHQSYDIDFSDGKGQAHFKRAIEAAVPGGSKHSQD